MLFLYDDCVFIFFLLRKVGFDFLLKVIGFGVLGKSFLILFDLLFIECVCWCVFFERDIVDWIVGFGEGFFIEYVLRLCYICSGLNVRFLVVLGFNYGFWFGKKINFVF